MTGITPAVAERKANPPRNVKPNGHARRQPGTALHIDPRVDMRRPYILESGSFYKRMQADLNYADTELEMIRINQRALIEREADLMLIRDTALQALGQMESRMNDLGAQNDQPMEEENAA